MKKSIFLGFILGILSSVLVYAADNNLFPKDVSGDDIKIVVQKIDGDYVQGRIMIRIDDSWYQFENAGYRKRLSSIK